MKARASKRVKADTLTAHDAQAINSRVTRASKRLKTGQTSEVPRVPGSSLAGSAHLQLSIPFRTGPSLEHVPDDVLDEIMSHLPTLTEDQALFAYQLSPPVISSSALVRTPTLRALSQTSRILRSRCLAMAWKKLELCGVSLPRFTFRWGERVGETTEIATYVLKECPHLLPFIRTVSVVLTRFYPAVIVPKLAASLATLPNLTTLQVMHCDFRMKRAMKCAFKGKIFPSVLRVTLHCTYDSTHEILKCCPNVEEVTCIGGRGMWSIGNKRTVVQALIDGNCRRVRMLRGVRQSSSLRPLVESLPNLKYAGVLIGEDLAPLTGFPLLDTIELDLGHSWSQTAREHLDPHVERAIEILKGNESKAKKTVLLTRWHDRRDVDHLRRIIEGQVYDHDGRAHSTEVVNV